MDTELHTRNQEVSGDCQEEFLRNEESCYEATGVHIKMENDDDCGNSSLQNTNNLIQAIATGEQEVKVERVDYLPSGTTDSNFNLHGNQDTALMNIKQEVEVDEATFSGENSNIYIFENADLSCEVKGNVGQDMLVEIIKVKQAIQDTNLNIETCVSGAKTVEFKNNTIDSQTDPVDKGFRIKNEDDLQHNLMVNRPPGSIINPGLKVQTVTKNSSNNVIPHISQVKEHWSGDNGYRGIPCKLTKQVNIKPGKSSMDCNVMNKDQLINANGLPLTCVMCGKEVRTLNGLIEHICIICHNPIKSERPYQCSVCGRGFKIFPDLRKHIIRHSWERTHQCNVCGKKFKTFTELRKHMISHSTERPHQCSVCVKEFKILQDLKKHMISHSTERPHQCYVCNKQYKSPDALRLHRNIKHRTTKSVTRL